MAPTLEQVIGQDGAVGLLRRILAAGKAPHAYLVHGPDGVGKWDTVLAFAKALLCTGGSAAEDGDACGSCRSCRMVESASHPDLYRIGLFPKKEWPNNLKEKEEIPPKPLDYAPEGQERFTQIRIPQVRWLVTAASHPPAEGRHRIFVIDPADRLNHQSQNAILKTLEEPESRSMIILVTARPHVLLPTIRSRCVVVGLRPVDPAELAGALVSRGFVEAEAELRAALSSGRPVAAMNLDLEAMKTRRAGLLDDLTALTGSPAALADLPAMSRRILGEDEADTAAGLDLLQGLLRDVARSGSGPGGGRLLNADLSGELAGLAQRIDSFRAAALVELVDRLRADLRFNINRNLLAETILAELART